MNLSNSRWTTATNVIPQQIRLQRKLQSAEWTLLVHRQQLLPPFAATHLMAEDQTIESHHWTALHAILSAAALSFHRVILQSKTQPPLQLLRHRLQALSLLHLLTSHAALQRLAVKVYLLYWIAVHREWAMERTRVLCQIGLTQHPLHHSHHHIVFPSQTSPPQRRPP